MISYLWRAFLRVSRCVWQAATLTLQRLVALARGSRLLLTEITPLSSRHSDALGDEVGLLPALCGSPAQPGAQVLWSWRFTSRQADKFGAEFVGNNGARATLAGGDEVQLCFRVHKRAGRVAIAALEQCHVVDLFGFDDALQFVHVSKSGLALRRVAHGEVPAVELARDDGERVASRTDSRSPSASCAWTAAERLWLDHVDPRHPVAIGVLHPAMRGVRSSTLELLPDVLELRDYLDEAEGERMARLLLETGCSRFVLAAFPRSYRHLVSALWRLKPEAKLFNLWFGSFLQCEDDAVWSSYCAVKELCESGQIYKWGFAKKGMAEVAAASGLRTGFVMSLVRRCPERASTPFPGPPLVGLWAAEPRWEKRPFVMLAALRLLPGVRAHGYVPHERAVTFANQLGLKWDRYPSPVPQSEMPGMLARSHANLYVTFGECAPMLPLESLASGAPCLLGPVSHYFEDEDYLFSRLVVPFPERAEVIAAYLSRAIEEREEIVAAYARYAPSYNLRALQSLADFLETDVSQLTANDPPTVGGGPFTKGASLR